jgi:hypothetical protein
MNSSGWLHATTTVLVARGISGFLGIRKKIVEPQLYMTCIWLKTRCRCAWAVSILEVRMDGDS